ncbi:MAG TPA: radical SAM/SPASM domain-containing protein [Thermoanaerobaculia bacterium]|nr:radical SAM/SPASM domain-containing protein [Thermoanaerobaculia bacterium]
MIDQLIGQTEKRVPAADRLVAEPFLHFGPDRIYNTLTDLFLASGEPGFRELHELREGRLGSGDLPAGLLAELFAAGWLIETAADLGGRFRLKYVSLEASTVCNQACYFCPVSVDRREDHFMSMDFYEEIVAQLAAHRATIEGVSMIHYNEPTADKRFLDQVRVLKRYGLPPAVLTNATGLTPQRVDAILEMGGLSYLSVNLSTLDRERYKRDRGGDHLPMVLRNLDYFKDKPLAPTMDLAVLGTGDELHRQDFEAIRERFDGSRFKVHFYEVMDRAGAVPIGLHPFNRHQRLCGCEQTGSRPVQWVHVNPLGQCVLCCQDYHDKYVIGDLHEETLDAILSGPRMALLRRWVYGMEPAPEDFICRQCIYALTA